MLKSTYGVFVYQEQIIKAAQVLANWDASTADILRYCIGKKDKQKMEIMIKRFTDDCLNNNISKDVIDKVVDVFKASSSYSFNASHALAYSMISYQTAWFKTHYPTQFYLGNLSVSTDQPNTQNYVQTLYYDALKHKVNIRRPQIGEFCPYTYIKSDDIILGLEIVKNARSNDLDKICEILNNNRNIYDIIVNSKKSKIGKNTLFALIKSGMLDVYFKDVKEERFKYSIIAEALYMLSINQIEQLHAPTLINKDFDLRTAINNVKQTKNTLKAKELIDDAYNKTIPYHFLALDEAFHLGIVFTKLPENTYIIYDYNKIYTNNRFAYLYKLLNHQELTYKRVNKMLNDDKELININNLHN